jgi:gamma-glutamyltranspeptidase
VAAKHGLPRGVPPLAMTGVRVWRCDSLDAVLHDRSDDLTRDFTLDVEATMRAETIAGLKGLGHQLKAIDDPYMDFGSGQFIWRLSDLHEDGYVAASDSRRDGQAVGF